MKKTPLSMAFESPSLASALNRKANDKADTDAFYAVKPLSIRCCSSVENFRANKDISAIPLNDFVQRNGLKEYTTTNKVTAQQLKAVWTDNTFQKHFVTEFEAELFDPHYTDQFVLVDMGQEMGQGLFLAPDAKKILAGSTVLIYSGEFCDRGFQQRDYGLAIDPTFDHSSFTHETESALISRNHSTSIDAQSLGNLSRFIQGAPDQMELEQQFTDKDAISEKVCCANLQQRLVIHQGFPVIFLQAFRDINPGEILTFSYGQDYFNLRGGSKVFSDSGKIIGSLEGGRLISSCPADEISSMKSANRIDYDEAKKILFTKFQESTNLHFKERFINSTFHALSTVLTMKISEPHQTEIKSVLDSFMTQISIAKKYSTLRNFINSDLCKKELIYLRRYLMTVCTDFSYHHANAQATEKTHSAGIN